MGRRRGRGRRRGGVIKHFNTSPKAPKIGHQNRAFSVNTALYALWIYMLVGGLGRVYGGFIDNLLRLLHPIHYILRVLIHPILYIV